MGDTSIYCCYVLLVFIVGLVGTGAKEPYLRSCANEDCSEVISHAKSTITYYSDNDYTLSFKKNEDVIVYSKSAGSDTSLWGVSINGQRGYAPKMFLKETKRVGKIKYEVPTEFYEVINGELVRKKTKQRLKERNVESEPPENVLGSEEINETNSLNIENTDELNSQDVVGMPAIFSGVSGEIVDDNINASPPYEVIDGTTIPLSLDEYVKEESVEIDVEDDENEEDNSYDTEEDNSIEESKNLEQPELASQQSENPSSIQADQNVESETVDLNNIKNDNNVSVDTPLKDEQKPEEPQKESSEVTEKPLETVTASVESSQTDEPIKVTEKPFDTVTASVESSQTDEPIKVTEKPFDTVTASVESSQTDEPIKVTEKPLDTVTASVESSHTKEPISSEQDSKVPETVTIQSDQKQDVVVPNDSTIEIAATSESPNLIVKENIPDDVVANVHVDNSLPDVPNIENIPQPPEIKRDPVQAIVMPPVDTSEPMSNQYLPPNIGDNLYVIPPLDMPPLVINPNVITVNKEEVVNNELSLGENDTNDPKHSKQEDIVQPAPPPDMNGDSAPVNIQPEIEKPSHIHHQSDNIESAPATESPPTQSTFGGSDYEIPMMRDFVTEYVSSTIPPRLTEESPSDIKPSFEQEILTPNVEVDNINNENLESHNLLPNDFEKLFDTENQQHEFDPVTESIITPPFESSNESVEEGESFMSNVLNSFGSITDRFVGLFKSNHDSHEVDSEGQPEWIEEKLPGDVDRVVVGWNSFLASFLPAYSALPQCRPDENVIAMTEVSTDLVMWLVISAVSVLLFTLGYYFLENRKQDGQLLAMVNTLQKELFCSSKECILLKDELSITKEKLMGIEDSSFGSNEMVACLKIEIADSQHTVSELQERLTQTEEELANSTEAALELQAILDEQLSSKDTSNSSLTFTVTNLQAQLDEQQATMTLTKGQLAAKVEENEMLMAKIVEVGNKTATIEKELLDTQNQLRQAREECEHKSQQLHELSNTMEKSLQQLKNQKVGEIKDLQGQLKNCKGELESSKVLLKARAHEVTSLQENLKLLKIDGTNIDSLIDVSHTKAELLQVTTEKNILNEKLEKEQSLLHELTNKVEVQDNQMKQMRDQLNEAEQNAIQSTSRLEVLTNYFNQKEAELIKELNTKEELWLSQKGENMSTVEKIQSLQQEIQQYKETAESVRRELAEQEAAWRARNAALERRAHEQWLARRVAERQAEAAATEAQSLRHRLAAPSPTDKPQGMVSPLNSVEGIGDIPMLPPPLPFPHFPPMGGLPPPPFLPPPLPPHRPPPLGRLSSPPPLPLQHMRHDRYSPNSRYSPGRDRDYSPDRRSTGRSPYSQDGRRRQYNNSRRYDDERYYDSGEDRRPHRRYDETETDFSPPPSPPLRRAGPRNHKGVSSGSGQSSESLERISKHSNKY